MLANRMRFQEFLSLWIRAWKNKRIIISGRERETTVDFRCNEIEGDISLSFKKSLAVFDDYDNNKKLSFLTGFPDIF